MVPIISVTPHSPGTKFNNILGKFHCIWSTAMNEYSFGTLNVNELTLYRFSFFLSIEDTLNHLQNIRESVVQLKNSASSSHHNHHHHHHQYYMASGLINPAVSSQPNSFFAPRCYCYWSSIDLFATFSWKLRAKKNLKTTFERFPRLKNNNKKPTTFTKNSWVFHGCFHRVHHFPI